MACLKQESIAQEQVLGFLQGAKKFYLKLKATHSDLKSASVQGQRNKQGLGISRKDRDTAAEVGTDYAETDCREMHKMLEFPSDGRVGYLLSKKRKGMDCLMFENWNGLGLFGHNWKVDKLNHLVKHHSVDIVAGCKSGTDWSFVEDAKQFLNILTPGTTRRGAYAHNDTPGAQICHKQVGGTAVAGTGWICDVIIDSGKDPTGLGHYCWIKVGNGRKTTRIVSGYLPCRPDRWKSKGRTRWEMEERYFQARNDWREPPDILISDLLAQFKVWWSSGEQIMLAIDANSNVYDGQLAQAISEPGLDMSCMFEDVMGSRVPNSHFRGTEQIARVSYRRWYGVSSLVWLM